MQNLNRIVNKQHVPYIRVLFIPSKCHRNLLKKIKRDNCQNLECLSGYITEAGRFSSNRFECGKLSSFEELQDISETQQNGLILLTSMSKSGIRLLGMYGQSMTSMELELYVRILMNYKTLNKRRT
ncbi:uncharacterized protein LOC129776747 isoform X4 [Toxorhynchites rutilus septentrionalis]|uniref:uncharacterized protein LOC129776747 isoform X4 n=1 Tax=Toxorhynchites rutilus septentrionalis TaxID=329112 RepID=UPI002479B6FF|nr:uncharacterized protein LOC129776747 isoform X4 [Toxorhynchites rutilus septentrionalis]